MNQAVGTSMDASGGVTCDEQDRRPEVCADRLRVKHIESTKAVNRRKLLMVFYPLWVVGFAMVFLGLMIAEWWDELH